MKNQWLKILVAGIGVAALAGCGPSGDALPDPSGKLTKEDANITFNSLWSFGDPHMLLINDIGKLSKQFKSLETDALERQGKDVDGVDVEGNDKKWTEKCEGGGEIITTVTSGKPSYYFDGTDFVHNSANKGSATMEIEYKNCKQGGDEPTLEMDGKTKFTESWDNTPPNKYKYENTVELLSDKYVIKRGSDKVEVSSFTKTKNKTWKDHKETKKRDVKYSATVTINGKKTEYKNIHVVTGKDETKENRPHTYDLSGAFKNDHFGGWIVAETQETLTETKGCSGSKGKLTISGKEHKLIVTIDEKALVAKYDDEIIHKEECFH